MNTTRQMNVAIFHNIMWSKYKGGVFSAVHDLTRGTDTHVSFTQIAETEGERVALGGVDLSYHRYPYELIFPGAYHAVPLGTRIRSLMSRAWQTKADMVVLPGYERLEYWAMLLVLMLRGKPRAVFCDSTAHDRPHTALKSLAKRFFFSRCQGFFGYGSRSREYLMLHGVPSERICFRCQAAALPHDYTEHAALAARAAKGPHGDDAPRYLYVGRLAPEKGLGTMIEAMAQVVKQHPDASLHVVGAGPMAQTLASWVNQHGLQNNVHLLGSMDIAGLAKQYARATALLLPSTSEPWGLVANEAMSYGCPVIASHVCGCMPELIVNGRTGYSFHTGNAAELAARMVDAHTVLAAEPATAQHCVEHMRQFTPRQAAQQIVAGCQRILGLPLAQA